MAVRLLYPINSNITKNNKNLIRSTTDFDFKFITDKTNPGEINEMIRNIDYDTYTYLTEFIKYYKSLYNTEDIELQQKILLKFNPRRYNSSHVYYISSWELKIGGKIIDIIDTTLMYKPNFNKNTLKINTFPILKTPYMIKEFASVVTESFLSKPNSRNHRRNPISGVVTETANYKQKGLKNIARMKSLCLQSNNSNLCKLITNLSIAVNKRDEELGKNISKKIKKILNAN